MEQEVAAPPMLPPVVPVEAVTDRVTQLQDKIDALGDKFYTFIGILQRDAPPQAFDEFRHIARGTSGAAARALPPGGGGMPNGMADGGGEQQQQHGAGGGPILPALPSIAPEQPAVPTGPTMEIMEGEAANMARLLLTNVKEVDMLIDSLPGINSTKPEQMKRLEELEKQNQQMARRLRETLSWAEDTLVLVHQALAEIYTDRLLSINEQARLDKM